MEYRRVALAAAPILLCACISLMGCFSRPPPSSYPPPFDGASYSCESDVRITNLKKISSKGMCVDDISFFICPEFLLQKWPHTEEDIRHVRLFKASRPGDSEELVTKVRENFVKYVKANNITVLVGSQITCDASDDDRDWRYVKLMIEALGKEHVLALQVGNEVDQMYHYDDIVSSDCLDHVWGDYFYEQTRTRIKWAREKLGNPELLVTSAFNAESLYPTAGWPGPGLPDSREVKMATYLKRIFNSGEKHFVFSFNIYPLFDRTLKPDEENHTECQGAIQQARCFDEDSCRTTYNVVHAKKQVRDFMAANPDWKMTDAPLWIGEVGWSSPQPDTYDGPMNSCPAFFSKNMLFQYYERFLQWDWDGDAPDKVFYFTMRDASNYGVREYFGLVAQCENAECKIAASDTRTPWTSMVDDFSDVIK